MVIRLPDRTSVMVELGAQPQIQSENLEKAGYGIACDIGTTTVVCHLVELSSGKVLAGCGEENAQRAYGDDVISRIKASMDGSLTEMVGCIRRQISGMILRLCREAEITVGEIHTMAVAGNTVMCHILLGLSPDSMGTAPYAPQSKFGQWYPAEQLELPFCGQVYIAPAVSGFVGGDITADILAAGLDQTDKMTLLIDVGTNGEMALGCGDHFICCSTAAGPAFEGAQIRCGMTAAPGAISGVQWHRGEVLVKTIGDVPPVGICGSGFIDAAAMLLEIGAVDETGRMLDADEDTIPEELEPYLYLEGEEPAFCLAEDVFVTQSDIRKLQLGKAAIAAGVQVMGALSGEAEIGQLLLAGGFGSYIRPERAACIGLIPEQLLPVTRAMGNAAAQGAVAALCSQSARERLTGIQNSMEYLELSGMQKFSDAYIENMIFPEKF